MPTTKTAPPVPGVDPTVNEPQNKPQLDQTDGQKAQAAETPQPQEVTPGASERPQRDMKEGDPVPGQPSERGEEGVLRPVSYQEGTDPPPSAVAPMSPNEPPGSQVLPDAPVNQDPTQPAPENSAALAPEQPAKAPPDEAVDDDDDDDDIPDDAELNAMTRAELDEVAAKRGLNPADYSNKADLTAAIKKS